MTVSIRRIAEFIHALSAFWVIVIAGIIIVDVSGRALFNTPFLGAIEIIKNSVVSITFLQLPLAIFSGSMLRTTILTGIMPLPLQRLMRVLAGLLGFLFFAGIAYSSWDPFLEAVAINEYEGEGALRVPTYPVRLLVVLTSVFSALVYIYLAFLDLTGRFDPDEFYESSKTPEGA